MKFDIPLKIFQTWYTKDLSTTMKKHVDLIKELNPEFEHFLYDDNDCKEFIEENFGDFVLNAYNSLIPGAYKADLWRYCVLYIYGGIYLDIKFTPVNDFKFIDIFLLNEEQFVIDRPINVFFKEEEIGIYNGLIICKPNNELLLKCIYQIVENVNNKYYGYSCLYPTGPGLLGQKYYNNEKNDYKKELNNFRIKYEGPNEYKGHITFDNEIILEEYIGFRNEKTKEKYYIDLWKSRGIYKK
jgi:mannosyltransferase OCH1-like enzyme